MVSRDILEEEKRSMNFAALDPFASPKKRISFKVSELEKRTNGGNQSDVVD